MRARILQDLRADIKVAGALIQIGIDGDIAHKVDQEQAYGCGHAEFSEGEREVNERLFKKQ